MAGREKATRVQLSSGVEKLIALDDRPLEAQVQVCILQFHIDLEEQGSSWVLTNGTGPEAVPLRNLTELRELRTWGRTVGLISGVELIQSKLGRIRVSVEKAEKLALQRSLESLLNSIWGADCLLIEQAIQDDALNFLIGALTAIDVEDTETIEVTMACMSCLIQHDEGLDKLQAWQDSSDDEAVYFYQRILEVLIAPAQSPEVTTAPLFNTLFFTLYVLHELPDTVIFVHEALAAKGDDNEEESLYQKLLDAVNPEDFQDFRGEAAISIMSALHTAAMGDEEVETAMREEIETCDLPDDSLEDLLMDPEQLLNNMMSLSMHACIELAALNARDSKRAQAEEKVMQLEKRIEQLTEVNHFMRDQCQRRHKEMTKLIPFVKVESDNVVHENMPQLIASEWNTLQFKNGYSILHYAAEFTNDPAVIDMLVAFCTNPRLADKTGMTPLDYARKSGHKKVIKFLEEHLQEGEQCHETESADNTEKLNVLQKALEELEDVQPKLRAVLDSVLKVGWHAITWPEGFTALHLAAKCGHVGAIHLLLEAGAGPELGNTDTWNLTAMDYAVQGNHIEVISLIQQYISEGAEAAHPCLGIKHKGRKAASLGELDLLKERDGATARTLDELTEVQLRAKVDQLDNKLLETQSELERLARGSPSSGVDLMAGTLDEEQLKRFAQVLMQEGEEATLQKLTTGGGGQGLNLPQAKAIGAMRQLELVVRLIRWQQDGAKGGGKGLKGPANPGELPRGELAPIPEEQEASLPRSDTGLSTGKGGKGGKGKGKAKGAGSAVRKKAEPSKPVRTPPCKLKAIWWGDPWILGGAIERGTTIWEEVEDENDSLPLGALCDNFGVGKVEAVKNLKPASKEPKIIEVILDAQELIGVEGVLERLPAPHIIAKAVTELDETMLPEEKILQVMRCACPDEAQIVKLQHLLATKPHLPLSKSSIYFKELSKVSYAKERCKIWYFTLTVYETVNLHSARIQEFITICERIMHSQAIAVLLSVLLSVGNYMNGGSIRGRADAFDLAKGLVAMSSCKGKAGKELTAFQFKYFQEKSQQKLEKCMDELGPVFLNVKKGFVGEKLNKKVVVVLEDYDSVIRELLSECAVAKESLERVMINFSDQMNEFLLQMPGKFHKAESAITNLQRLKDNAAEKFKKTLAFLHMKPETKSDDFCLLWDNFFIQPERVNSLDPRMMKSFFVPYFCKGAPISTYALTVFWGIRDFNETEAEKNIPALKMQKSRAQKSLKKVRRFENGKVTKISTRHLRLGASQADLGGSNVSSGAVGRKKKNAAMFMSSPA